MPDVEAEPVDVTSTPITHHSSAKGPTEHGKTFVDHQCGLAGAGGALQGVGIPGASGDVGNSCEGFTMISYYDGVLPHQRMQWLMSGSAWCD